MGITLAVLVASLVLDVKHTGGFFFDGRWLMFAAGIGVFYDINYASRSESIAIRCAFFAGVIWAFCDLGSLCSFYSTAQQEAFASCAFALLLVFIHKYDSSLADCRCLWPISFCGTMCYSLYLVHWPVCKALSHWMYDLGVTSNAGTALLTVPACVCATVIVAWVFHHLVERYFLNVSPSAKDSGEALAVPHSSLAEQVTA